MSGEEERSLHFLWEMLGLNEASKTAELVHYQEQRERPKLRLIQGGKK